MTLKNYLRASEKTATKIIDKIDYQSRDTLKANITFALQEAFSEGAQSIIETQLKKVKIPEAASLELEQSLSDCYLSASMDIFKEFITKIVLDVSTSGRLNIGWQESIAASTEDLIKTIYDLAFINGIAVAQDPLKLKLYLKNKERAVTHAADKS